MSRAANKRGVLIGCGFFADNHLHAWTGLDGIDIVAVCDLDEEKARKAAETFGIAAVYTDASTMIEAESPDLVDIVTTVPSHRALVELACAPGRLVICQKPFADSVDDAEAMVAAAAAAPCELLVHENFRWQQPFVDLSERLGAGDIGRVRFARLGFRHAYDIYTGQPYLKDVERLAIMDVGLHLFDLARHLMGEVQRVECVTQRRHPDVAGEDAFTALLTHVDDKVSVVDCSFDTTLSPDPFPQTMATVEGDTGTLELAPGYDLRLHRGGRVQAFAVEPEVPAWGERPWHLIQDSVIRFQRHALDVLHGRAEPQPSGRDNLETLRVAMAAYRSAGAPASR